MSGETTNADALRITLSVAVPQAIAGYVRRGVWAHDWARVRHVADELAHRGDVLLFRSEVPGQTAALFDALTDALAVLSFTPGGVRAFGLHFETAPPAAGFEPAYEPAPRHRRGKRGGRRHHGRSHEGAGEPTGKEAGRHQPQDR